VRSWRAAGAGAQCLVRGRTRSCVSFTQKTPRCNPDPVPSRPLLSPAHSNRHCPPHAYSPVTPAILFEIHSHIGSLCQGLETKSHSRLSPRVFLGVSQPRPDHTTVQHTPMVHATPDPIECRRFTRFTLFLRLFSLVTLCLFAKSLQTPILLVLQPRFAKRLGSTHNFCACDFFSLFFTPSDPPWIPKA
jgi:hypothetical protein